MDLDTLNPAQRSAVITGPGPRLVVAGAGTGKTRTLVHRVAWLLEQGVPPRGIVLLTFTRRAASEMLARVSEMAGITARAVRGGTFHGFANTALRRNARLLGYTPAFTILDRSDAERLVGLCRDELGLSGKGRRFAKRNTILKVLSKAINTQRKVEDILWEEYPQYAADAADFVAIGERYTARKRAQNVMDYDDLLVNLAELLAKHPEARRRMSEAALHVLVDEYQDTNRLQASIALLLSSSHGNLMVVGDEAQSIYGFRGAAVENILDFGDVFPEAEIIKLEHNYRSTQPILDLANAVLDSARQGYDKRLFTDLEGGDKPILVDAVDEQEQAVFITQQVLALREDGVPLEQMAVLFRSASHANMLEVNLTQANIPFRKFGGIRFAEAAHVKDVFALLRLVANPRDELAWLRVLEWFRGLGAKSAQQITTAIVASDDGVLQADAYIKRKFGPDLVSLAAALNAADGLRHDLPALVDQLVTWYRGRMADLYEDAKRRQKDLDTLLVLAGGYRDLEHFLAEVALDPPSSSDVEGSEREDEWLTLSTIHSAKGLEWGVVFVMHLGDGHFPSGFTLDDPEQVEEERRLFYVAVTRARRTLYMVRPRLLRTRWGPAGAPGCLLLDDLHGLHQLVDEGQIIHDPSWLHLEPADPVAVVEDRLRRIMERYGP